MRMTHAKWSLTCCMLLGSLASAQEPSTANARAERRLAELLTPGGRMNTTGMRAKPLSTAGPRWIEEPSTPIAIYQGLPPRVTNPPQKVVVPRSAAEGPALIGYRADPALPVAVVMPALPAARQAGVDASTPIPLPTLARPQKDRASLADPTNESSLAAVLQPFTPTRTTPVPFAPLNLPDPFENQRVGQLPNPPAESATPPVIPVRLPKAK